MLIVCWINKDTEHIASRHQARGCVTVDLHLSVLIVRRPYGIRPNERTGREEEPDEISVSKVGPPIKVSVEN